MDWGSIERSVHAHTLSALADGRRRGASSSPSSSSYSYSPSQSQSPSPRVCDPSHSIRAVASATDSSAYENDNFQNEGLTSSEVSIGVHKLNAIMDLIAQQGERLDILRNDFDRAQREAHEEREAWFLKVKVAEDASSRAASACIEARKDRQALEEIVSLLEERLACLEAAVANYENEFTARRTFDVVTSEILHEAAELRALAVASRSESARSTRTVQEMMLAFRAPHWRATSNTFEPDNSEVSTYDVVHQFLEEVVAARAVDAARKEIEALEHNQPSSKQKNDVQARVQAIESNFRRMQGDLQRCEANLSALETQIQSLDAEAVELRSGLDEVRGSAVTETAIERQLRRHVDAAFKSAGIKDSKGSIVIPKLVKDIGSIRSALDNVQEYMTTVQDAVSGNCSHISELESSFVDVRRVLLRKGDSSRHRDDSLQNDSFSSGRNFRAPLFTNYFSQRLQGGDVSLSRDWAVSYARRLPVATSIDDGARADAPELKFAKEYEDFDVSKNNDDSKIREDMPIENKEHKLIAGFELAEQHPAADASRDAVSQEASHVEPEENTSGTTSENPPQESEKDITARSDGETVPPSPDDDAPESGAESEDRNDGVAADTGRSAEDEDSSDGEITIGPRDDSSRVFGPPLPQRSSNQVPGRQHLDSRYSTRTAALQTVPRAPGGASSGVVYPVNIPSIASAKAATPSSSSDDTTQCQYCLRRVKKVDAKHHATVCELRTEICRLGCRARVLAIKMDKHCETCPCNPDRVVPAAVGTSKSSDPPSAPARPPPLPPSAAVVAASLIAAAGKAGGGTVVSEGVSRTTPSLT